MKILKQHEQMEMFVLDEMRKIKILDQMIFGGGTMLRLCFDLPRYSVDLDFYLKDDKHPFRPWADKFSKCLGELGAVVTDHQEKHFTYLWEFKLADYPRKLKIEARKEPKEAEQTEITIAHSPFSPLQVRLTTLSLQQMWINKVRALTDRVEIRDAYDLEFLTRRRAGSFEALDKAVLGKMMTTVEAFTKQDFKVKLGSVLDEEERKTVLSNRFGYLKSKIAPLLT